MNLKENDLSFQKSSKQIIYIDHLISIETDDLEVDVDYDSFTLEDLNKYSDIFSVLQGERDKINIFAEKISLIRPARIIDNGFF